jgi:hypothetical protein
LLLVYANTVFPLATRGLLVFRLPVSGSDGDGDSKSDDVDADGGVLRGGTTTGTPGTTGIQAFVFPHSRDTTTRALLTKSCNLKKCM